MEFESKLKGPFWVEISSNDISLETFKTYEDALNKALQVEMDEDILAYPMDRRLEEQLEIVKNL